MLRNNACKKICKSRFVKNKHCVKRCDATKGKRWKNFQTFYYARWKKCEKSVWIKSVYKFLKMNYYSSFLNWNEIFVNNVTRAKWKNIFAEPKEILEIESRKEGSGFTFSADLFKCNINADYAFFLFFFYPQVGVPHWPFLILIPTSTVRNSCKIIDFTFFFHHKRWLTTLWYSCNCRYNLVWLKSISRFLFPFHFNDSFVRYFALFYTVTFDISFVLIYSKTKS